MQSTNAFASMRHHLAAAIACDGEGERPGDLDLFDVCAAFVRQRPRLIADGTPAMSVEASLAVRSGRMCARRYIVGVPLAALGRSPWQDLGAWLDCVAAPAEVLACLQRLRAEREVPTAVHLGVERPTQADENRRFYVERRPLQALLGVPGAAASLAMVGAQWSVGSPAVRWRQYLEGSAATAPAPPADLAHALALHASAAAGYVWQRTDLGERAEAHDMYWHFRAWPLADAVDALAALAERHCGSGQACATALRRIPAGTLLKAVGVGADARGPRVKVYHAPPERAP